MKKIQYLDLEHVMTIHDLMIDEMGGSYGVRDMGLVESATMQPRQSFGGFELYPSLFEKAAAYAFFISENQPFIDGNKRTAASVAGVFLDINGYDLNCEKGQVYETIMKLANKKLTREKLAAWFKKNSVSKSKGKKKSS